MEERKEPLNYNPGKFMSVQNIPLPKDSFIQKRIKYTHIKRKAFMLAFPEQFWEYFSKPLTKKIFRGNIFLNRSSFLESQT